MPTWIPGTDCVISVDNAADSLTDYSSYISTVTLDNVTQIGGFYVFGESAEQVSEGRRSHSCSMGVRPATDAAGFYNVMNAWKYPGAGVKSGSRDVQIDAPDSTTGSFRWAFVAYPENWQPLNSDAGGDGTAPSLNASFRINGDVTYSVIT